MLILPLTAWSQSNDQHWDSGPVLLKPETRKKSHWESPFLFHLNLLTGPVVELWVWHQTGACERRSPVPPCLALSRQGWTWQVRPPLVFGCGAAAPHCPPLGMMGRMNEEKKKSTSFPMWPSLGLWPLTFYQGMDGWTDCFITHKESSWFCSRGGFCWLFFCGWFLEVQKNILHDIILSDWPQARSRGSTAVITHFPKHHVPQWSDAAVYIPASRLKRLIFRVINADDQGLCSRSRRIVYPTTFRLLALSNEIYYVLFQYNKPY